MSSMVRTAAAGCVPRVWQAVQCSPGSMQAHARIRLCFPYRLPAASMLYQYHPCALHLCWTDCYSRLSKTVAFCLPCRPGGLLQGYGIIRFLTQPDVQRAVQEFNGYELEGRNLTVKLDQYA
jgi:RNA recognition motif. (a.k.a. RRM, RBD, or RNP domain)